MTKADKLLTIVCDITDETFEKMFKASGNITVTVYSNPKSQDFDEMNDKIRFIADNEDKKVYIFNAFDANHYDVAAKLRLVNFIGWANDYKTGTVRYLNGTAHREGRIYIADGSDTLYDAIDLFKRHGRENSKEYLFASSLLDQDWNWLNRYIKVDQMISQLKKRFAY